jgi:hypoxanthine phosphoribosyltransferase
MPPRASKRSPHRGETFLSPQSELPRGLLGQDRSRRRSTVPELSWVQLDALVHDLGREISQTFEPDLVVGIAHGGVFVGGALAAALDRPFQALRISRRSRDIIVRRGPRMRGTMPREVKGARVLLVDDVVASGDTLTLAAKLARKAGARDVRTVTVLCRDQGFTPDWTALVMEGPLVFPWDYGPVVEDERFDLGPEPVTAPRRGRS